MQSNTSINVNKEEIQVKIGDDLFYKNKFFYITGHGNIKFNPEETVILRNHLYLLDYYRNEAFQT